MEGLVVLIHAALVFILVIYLIIKLFVSLFSKKDPERKGMNVFELAFIVLIVIAGIYPLVVLGNIELYHYLKVVLLSIVIWLLEFSKQSRSLKLFVSVLLFVIMIYLSFIDKPVFPQEPGTFEKDHPEFAQLPDSEKGQFIFETLCVNCHGKDGRLGRFQAADLTISTLSHEEKKSIVTNGSPLTVMASFKNKLSEEEIERVVSFVDGLVNAK